jgi:hypothetical protein
MFSMSSPFPAFSDRHSVLARESTANPSLKPSPATQVPQAIQFITTPA